MGVVRVEQPARPHAQRGITAGWQARVYAADRTYTRFFSDRRNGGRERAWVMAREWWRRMELARVVEPYVLREQR